MGVLWSAAVVRMAETKGRGNVCRLPLIIIYDPQFSSSPFQEGATELLRVARSASARATHSYNRPLLHPPLIGVRHAPVSPGMSPTPNRGQKVSFS